MKFYWFDDSDNVVFGPFPSAREAQKSATEAAPSTAKITIVRMWSEAEPQALKPRRFKG